ncbi:MAG: S41 family peptidase [candidate division Zixibacteria bacterium]|nr:S41 family peptidase [candidate division Zixibacteria bacterium]MDD5427370.1 S41 family peptidase [candidate division Zixibacteria bacterium]
MKHRLTLLLAISGLLLLVPAVFGQVVRRAGGESLTVDSKMQMEIIDSISYALNEVYVFPDVAKEMEKHIRKQYKDKVYKDIITLDQFVQKLTNDLLEISHDKHLGVRVVPPEYLNRLQDDTLSDAERLRQLEQQQYNNFAFKKIELLPGNVGYLKFDGFNEALHAGGTAIAALNFLAYCDALIIDLRENGGGSPSMIQLITSYFFDEPKHINSFYVRKEDSINQFWTQAYVSGPRLSDVDLYILTSSYTFSAAEEFTYNLKNMERATIVGETTGGGAHPVDIRIFKNLKVGMSLPFGRAINPITGTNWEGTGIEPHIKTTNENAYNAAYLEALKKLYEKAADDQRKNILSWHISLLESKINPYTLDQNALNEFVGIYGPRKVTFEHGNLYYQRENNPGYKLIPMAKDKFYIAELDFFQVLFERDETGKIDRITGLYDNGRSDSNLKEK